MKAKVTAITQFNDTSKGLEAIVHTDLGNDVEMASRLRALGYETDFFEDSEEPGYDECFSVFLLDSCTTKKEFIRQLREDVRIRCD